MRSALSSSILLSLVAVSTLATGCRRSVDTPGPTEDPEVPAITATWIEQGIEHAGKSISLGYRGTEPLSDDRLLPVAAIADNGKPDARALVFVAVSVDPDDESILAETACVFEAGPDAGYYSPGPVPIPEDATQCIVEYRIVLEGAEEDLSREVTIPLK